ncbi:RNA polymerase sigma-70 factor [Prolixibacteraceae bacterium JC049]|nr:RNA polymerase sigma-70 factor [Prolixibacteraceae bacterium JC049]
MLLEEKLLLNEIRRKNSDVYEKIFNKHYEILVNFAIQFVANAAIAEDVVQSVFIYVWENSSSIKIEKSIKAYLFQAVKNGCLNHIRSLKIRDKHELLYLEALLDLNNDEILSDSDVMQDIKRALDELPEQMHEIFCKKYFADKSIKEIAQELSLSENTIKVQLHNGRNKVREQLKKSTGIYFFL